MRILSIDACRSAEGGWDWNQWFNAGEIERAEFERIADRPRKLLRWMREHGKLAAGSAGRVAIEDDGYNVVIVSRANREPLFAIEYGSDE